MVSVNFFLRSKIFFRVFAAAADEDFVISDDDVDFRELSSEGSDDRPGRRRRGSVDSDFVADEYDSGSDWESAARKPMKQKVCRHNNKQ